MSSFYGHILLISEEPVLRLGLRCLIEHEHDFEVCGEASSVASALAEIRLVKPDIAILDVALVNDTGLNLINQLRNIDFAPKVVVLSHQGDIDTMERASRGGAQGCIAKSRPVDEIIETLRRVMRGEDLARNGVPPRLVRGFGASDAKTDDSAGVALSRREGQVLEFLGQGLGSREIGRRLSISVKTVDSHREHLKRKLKLETAYQLIRRAVIWNLENSKAHWIVPQSEVI